MPPPKKKKKLIYKINQHNEYTVAKIWLRQGRLAQPRDCTDEQISSGYQGGSSTCVSVRVPARAHNREQVREEDGGEHKALMGFSGKQLFSFYLPVHDPRAADNINQ